MRSIHSESKKLKRACEKRDTAREAVFSMLDNSDDENFAVKTAETNRKNNEPAIRKALRNRDILTILTHYLPRSSTYPPLARRIRLTEEVTNGAETYTRTIERRARDLHEKVLNQYAFNGPPAPSDKPSDSESIHRPGVNWILDFCLLRLPIETKSDVWEFMGYTPESFLEWWTPKYPNPLSNSSDGWRYIKRLARRVVVQILERVQSEATEGFLHDLHLRMAAELCRETVLCQIILFHALPSGALGELRHIFEHTVPVVYLACTTAKLSSSTSANDVANLTVVEEQLQRLDPLLRELRKRSYVLGAAHNINPKGGKQRDCFNMGRVFDFDRWDSDKPGPSYLLAGHGKQEYTDPVDLIIKKQALVNETISNFDRSNFQSDISEDYETLDKKGKYHNPHICCDNINAVLESMGIEQITDIVLRTAVLLGSGAYADVHGMSRRGSQRQVAVKKLRMPSRKATRTEREARVWAKLKHKNIAPLLGFVYFTPALPSLVSVAYHCDLKSLVNKYKTGSAMGSGKVLTIEQKLLFLRDIVMGIEYLHASGIAHGDMRAVNILVTNETFQDPSCYAVINDFGMAEYYGNDIDSLLDSHNLSSVNQRTNDCWLSPELLDATPREGTLSRVSMEGDIYAFGVVFLEVVYKKDPYESTEWNVRFAKTRGELPAKKEKLDLICESHWMLMQGCWETQDKRISTQRVVWSILDMVDTLMPRTPTGPDGCENMA